MKFSICLIEPEGYRYSHFLYDACKYLCYSIEALGYDCCMVKNKFYSDRVNIILGAHYVHDCGIANQIKQTGKFVILQSELLREGGIAGWPDQPSFKTIYIPLMQNATAVWDGIESNRDLMGKFGIQAEWIPRFGYLPQLEEITHKKRKDIDFLYYGSLTPHRKKLIDELQARGGNVVCLFDEAAIFRNDYIARSRVHLAPKQSPEANQIPTRILYLINNRSVVVVERCKDQEWIENCFLSANTDHWGELCMETLKRPDLDHLTEQYHENFKKLDLTRLFQPLIDKLLEKQRLTVISTPNVDAEKKHSENGVQMYTPALSNFVENFSHGLISIIIVTHNCLEYTKKCIKSIRKHTPEPHEIIFVDNASTDSTLKWLRSQIKENKNYRLIENKENVGRIKGRNQGIESSQGEFILLLHNDVMVTEGWLTGMLECMNRDPNTGIVGPMSNHCNGLQRITNDSYQSVDYLDKYAAKFKKRFHHRRISYRNITGFCMLFKRTLVEKIGRFDEKFDTGRFEDEDFCLRAALEEYCNYIAGDVFVHHSGGKRSRIDRKTYEDKWALSTGSPEGRKLAVLKARDLANDFHQKGKLDQAIEALINCIKVTPDAKEIYYELARILIETKNFSEAWEVIETMPDAAKNDLKGLECAGYAKEGLELDEEAAEYADRMLSLNKDYHTALNLKGVLAFKKGEKDKAKNYFKKAIDADPGYGEAYTNLGVLYWGIDKEDKALAHLKNGFILSSNIPDVCSLYYSVISSLGIFSDAEDTFREAAELYPGNKNIAFLYIDILIQQGKFDIAIRKIEDALDFFGLDDGFLNAALAVREKIGHLQIEKIGKKGTLSLCMIVKDEEKYLVKCLKSVRDIVDEMIVIDTGSNDKTKDIAKVFGAKVFDFPWTGDFSAARNHSLAQATGDWILVLDADEVISSRDLAELKSLIRKRSSSPAAYAIVTKNYTNNASAIGWAQNNGQFPEEAGAGWIASSKVRLFPKRNDVFFSNPVHELLESSLKIANIPIHACRVYVHHYGKLDIARESQKGELYYLLGKIKYENDPENASYISELAKQALVLNKGEEAVELYLKLISVLEAHPEITGYPASEIFTQLASSYLIIDRYNEALLSARKAVENKIKTKEAFNTYALCEIIAGSLNKAYSVLVELLKTMPEYPPALFLMYIVFCLERNKEKSQEYFNLLLQKRILMSPLLNKIAEQLRTQGKREEALIIINNAIENKISDEETINLLATLEETTAR